MTGTRQELLAAEYVLGTLSPATTRALAEELPHNAALAAKVAAWRQHLQILEPDTDTITPPGGLWDRIEGTIAATEDAAASASLTIAAAAGAWETVLPGVARKILSYDPGADLESALWRFAAGAVFPPHDHRLDEECIVLEGSIRIGSVALSAGDFHAVSAGVPHGAAYSEHGALVFLKGERRAAFA